MTGKLMLAVWCGILLASGVARAAPGDPFGGDDAACVPQTLPAVRCENTVMKAYGKAVACVGRCHIARANEKLADGAAEEACEQTCQGKYDKAVAKVAALCPPGYDLPGLFASAESCVDTAPIYPCADTTPPVIDNVSCVGGSSLGSLDCSFTATDTCLPVHVTCTIDGEPVPCDGGAFGFSELSAGPHHVVIVAQDSCGSVNSTSETTWLVDSSPGDVVLIGHDYAVAAPAPALILTNAVNLTAARAFVRPIRVLGFDAGADPTEKANALAAINARFGPDVDTSATFTGTTSVELGEKLVGKDVLLVYDQHDPAIDLGDVSQSWYGALHDYLNAGGVVIVLDGLRPGGPSDTWKLLSGANQIDVGPSVDATGVAVMDTRSGDPIATGVGDYIGPANTVHYAHTDARATDVFATSSGPCVAHRVIP